MAIQMNTRNFVDTKHYFFDPHNGHRNWNIELDSHLQKDGEPRSPGHMTHNNAFHCQATGAIWHWTGEQGGRSWTNKGTPGGPGKSWTGETLPICGPPGPGGHPLAITTIWPDNYQELERQEAEQAIVHTTDFSRAPHQSRYFCRYCNARHRDGSEMQKHILKMAGERHPPMDTLYQWLHNAAGAGSPDLLRGTPMANHLPFMARFTGQIKITVANTMDMNMGNMILALRNNRRENTTQPGENTTPTGTTTENDQPTCTQRDVDIMMEYHHRNTVELQRDQAALRDTVNQLQRTIHNDGARNTAGSIPVIIEIPSASTEHHQPPPI